MIGGSGIISSEIAYRLLDNKHEVFMVNRGRRKCLIDHRADLILADIRIESVEKIKQKIGDRHFDAIIDSISFNKEQLEKTLAYTEGLYDQFFFISSSTVYKETGDIITEETPLENNNWKYAADKIECEKFLTNYFADKRDIFYTIIRPYVTYGKTRLPYAMLPDEQWSLANRLLCGKPVILWDKGEAICTLTHSKDFAIGVIGLIGNKMAHNQAFHITSEYHYTWKEVLSITAEELGVTPNVVFIPSDFIAEIMPKYYNEVKGDKGRTMLFDSSKIHKAVPEFDCKIDFRTGIKETLVYYKANPKQKRINHSWDGDMDHLIAAYYKSTGQENLYKNKMKYTSSISQYKNCLRYLKHKYAL